MSNEDFVEDPEILEELNEVEAKLLARWPESRLEPTLDRISALMDALGSPQLSYPTIHITGTNGKTTTTRMIDSLFRAMEYRTGRFTSPHLESILERVCINGEPIPAEGFIAAYEDIALYLDFIDSRQTHPISFFEAISALAFVAFAEFPVDIGIIEVGMGGEWDATNVVNSAVSVITPIGLDHMQHLGDTLEEIALTKSGIIKPGSQVVFAAQNAHVAPLLLAVAATQDATVFREGIEFDVESRRVAVGGQMLSLRTHHGTTDEIFLPLHGAHQASNAAVALATVEAFFGRALDADVIREAFASVDSPGRCEIVARNPIVILDAAHNPHGAASLVTTLSTEFTFDELICVFAGFGDKDLLGVLQILEPMVSTIHVTENSSPRSMPVDQLGELAIQVFGKERVVIGGKLQETLDSALRDAAKIRESESKTVGILVTGSVVTVGEARTYFRHERSESGATL